ncbi:MAG: hypothetical protein M3385_04645 [Actinomycetota bacterium]|nr:hypothetical protein [Actinomycetota bacterium]
MRFVRFSPEIFPAGSVGICALALPANWATHFLRVPVDGKGTAPAKLSGAAKGAS